MTGQLSALRPRGLWNWLATIALLLALWRVGGALLDWAVIDGHGWSEGPRQCAQTGGACWAVLAEKYRFILFGRYPFEQQWRPALASLLFILLFGVSAVRQYWRPGLAVLWLAVLAVVLVLMRGGVGGLSLVSQDQWGGLPITLLLSSVGCVAAFPLAVLVALGRRAQSLPVVRALCVLYIEAIRAVPLVALLFMASVMLPLFLPAGVSLDKLMRVQVVIILFAAAYLAEAVRGGLQALPRGQYEAAQALGLSYWQMQRRIILPQALRLVIPTLVNIFTGLFKDTSLVLIVGVLDLLSAGKVALADPIWQGFGNEVYLALGAVYLGFSLFLSARSRRLEAR